MLPFFLWFFNKKTVNILGNSRKCTSIVIRALADNKKYFYP